MHHRSIFINLKVCSVGEALDMLTVSLAEWSFFPKKGHIGYDTKNTSNDEAPVLELWEVWI